MITQRRLPRGRPLLDARTGEGLPAGVQARIRQTADGPRYVVLNHGTGPAEVPLPAPMRDELTGAVRVGSLRLDARGVAVLRPA
jgi:beta-galactosidase